ncbi:hypothetical protein P9112_001709 [Eukaryota sp. TZLM1-RC]
MDVNQAGSLNVKLPLGFTITSITTHNNHVFFGATDGTLTGYRTSTSLQSTQFFHVTAAKGPIRCLAFDPFNNLLFAGSDDGCVRIFNPFAVPIQTTTSVLGTTWKPSTGYIQTIAVGSGVLQIAIVPSIGIVVSATDDSVHLFKQNFKILPALIRSSLYTPSSLSFLPLSSLTGWVHVVRYECHRISGLTSSPVGVLALGDSMGSIIVADGEVFLNCLQESQERSREVSRRSEKRSKRKTVYTVIDSAHTSAVVDILIFSELSTLISIGSDASVGYFSIRTGKCTSRLFHPDKLKFCCIAKFSKTGFIAIDCNGTVFFYCVLSMALLRTSVYKAVSFNRRYVATPPIDCQFLTVSKNNDDLLIDWTFVIGSITKVKLYSVQVVANASGHQSSHTDSIIKVFPIGNESKTATWQFDDVTTDLIDLFDCPPTKSTNSLSKNLSTSSLNSLLPTLNKSNSIASLSSTISQEESCFFDTVSRSACFTIGNDNRLILWDFESCGALLVDSWIICEGYLDINCCIFVEDTVAFVLGLDNGVVKLFHAESRRSSEVQLLSRDQLKNGDDLIDDVIVGFDLLYQKANSVPFILVLTRSGLVFVCKTDKMTPWKISVISSHDLSIFLPQNIRHCTDFYNIYSYIGLKKVIVTSNHGALAFNTDFSFAKALTTTPCKFLDLDGNFLIFSGDELFVEIFDVVTLTKLSDFKTTHTSDVRSTCVIPPPDKLNISNGGLLCLFYHDCFQVWHYSVSNESYCLFHRPLPRYLSPSDCKLSPRSLSVLVGCLSGVLVSINLEEQLDEVLNEQG